MHILDNGLTSVTLNERGQITSLTADGITNVIGVPTDLFRAVIHDGTNWECVAFQREQAIQVTSEDDSLRIFCAELKTRDRVLPISVTLTVRLDGEKITFDSEIDNRSDATVDDWYYPCIGRVDRIDGEEPTLYYPRHIGEVIPKVGNYLKTQLFRENTYVKSDTYPGLMSMQWLMLGSSSSILYLSGRDDLFHASVLRAVGSKDGGVTLEMDKLAFVKPGECWKCPSYLLWLTRGNWQKGVREYREWASTWRHPVQPKDWIKKMNGFFLVINNQQYGDENWRYDTIPQLYDLAQAHGFDALGLFGWYKTGHDNNYPDLEVSESMGGADKLKEGIKTVQDRGGHVVLYNQGHLIDVVSDFYKKEGHLLEGKTRWGTGYHEVYDKYCSSEYLHFFSKKIFTTVCPSCKRWHDLMADKADWIRSFGADGILYDQIGGMLPYPCFDKTHEHLQDRPSLSHTQGRMALHRRIRQQVDSYPEYAYMTEHATDVHSQFIDCVHGIGSYPGAQNTGTAFVKSYNWDVPAGPVGMMADLFRYAFPETMITLRNPNPHVSVRYANYTLYYGFKLEMELRYLTDKNDILADEYKEDRIYVKKIADLRRAHEDYLLLGTFLSDEGLVNDNPAVKACLYRNAEGKKAAVLWNDTDSEQPVRVSAEGTAWTAWASTDSEGTGIPATIAPQQVMIIY